MEQSIQDAKAMKRLLKDEDFIRIFMNSFMTQSMHEMIFRDGINEVTTKQIESRRVLNSFIYDIIDQGEIAEEQI